MKCRLHHTVSLFLVFLLQNTPAISQGDNYIALVHSRHDTEKEKCEAITAYYFDGVHIRIDTIIKRSAPVKSNKESRLSVGLNDQVIKNRYLFTTIGLLIDIKEKKILLEDPGDFVSAHGDTIFFTPAGYWPNFILNGYSVKTGKIKKVLERPFENSLKHISPDYNCLVDVSYADADQRKIYLINKKGKKQLAVPDVGKGPLLYGGTHAFGHIPVKWLDNERFIYVKYIRTKKNGTVWQATENDPGDSSKIHFSRLVADTLPGCIGEFRIYNINTRADKLVVTTDSIYAPAVEDRFIADDTAIIFRNWGFSYCNYWKIDIKKATIEHYNANKVFKTSADTSYRPKGFDHRKNRVHWKGNEIGSFYGQDYEYADDMYAACGKLEPGGIKYIMFWSSQTKQWEKTSLHGFLGLMSFFKPAW